ncbi:hypothetical protein AB0I28_27040 [Phytomonospora sp. NPDC050363]|uniref:hypothetical protein n=1 Tax=Phytomonospora sp. NPDC050363 TaxID=3155642 RepID=UPI0033FD16AD
MATPLARPAKKFNPRRPNPAGFDRISPYEDVDTAEANLHFEDGQWNRDGPMRATDEGPGTNAPDLKEPWASDPFLKTRFHIEGHAQGWVSTTFRSSLRRKCWRTWPGPQADHDD